MYQAAVWGQMMSGGGHTTLTKALAFTGVPVMTRLPLITAEKKTAEWWSMLFEATMKSAGEEHRTLAISQNRHHQGVPSIAIILDGGWCKRKYKHTYNAISGMGTIIGKETLFLGYGISFVLPAVLLITLTKIQLSIPV